MIEAAGEGKLYLMPIVCTFSPCPLLDEKEIKESMVGEAGWFRLRSSSDRGVMYTLGAHLFAPFPQDQDVGTKMDDKKVAFVPARARHDKCF